MHLAIAFTVLAAFAAAAPVPVTNIVDADGALAARDAQASAPQGGSSTGWNGNPNGSSAGTGNPAGAGWYWSYGSALEAGVAKRGDAQDIDARTDDSGLGPRRFLYGGNDPAGPVLPLRKRQGSAYGGGPANVNNGWHGTSGAVAPYGNSAGHGTWTWYGSAPEAGIAKREGVDRDVQARDADADPAPDADPQGSAYGGRPVNVNNGWHGTSGGIASHGDPVGHGTWSWYGAAPEAGIAKREGADGDVQARDAAPQGSAYGGRPVNVNNGWHGTGSSAPLGNQVGTGTWTWYSSAPNAGVARDEGVNVEARDADPQGSAYGGGPANVNNGWHGTSGGGYASSGNAAGASIWNFYGSAPEAGVAKRQAAVGTEPEVFAVPEEPKVVAEVVVQGQGEVIVGPA